MNRKVSHLFILIVILFLFSLSIQTHAAPLAGITTRVSLASDGTQGNSNSYYSSISADGRYVAFGSEASNLVSGEWIKQLYNEGITSGCGGNYCPENPATRAQMAVFLVRTFNLQGFSTVFPNSRQSPFCVTPSLRSGQALRGRGARGEKRGRGERAIIEVVSEQVGLGSLEVTTIPDHQGQEVSNE